MEHLHRYMVSNRNRPQSKRTIVLKLLVISTFMFIVILKKIGCTLAFFVTCKTLVDLYETNFCFSALIISDIFLLLVLIVYLLLKELRNLKGKLLMALVFSLFVSFIVLATYKIKMAPASGYSPQMNECIGYRKYAKHLPNLDFHLYILY